MSQTSEQDPLLRDALVELRNLRERDQRLRRSSEAISTALQALVSNEDWHRGLQILVKELANAFRIERVALIFLNQSDAFPPISSCNDEALQCLYKDNDLLAYLSRKKLRTLAQPASLPHLSPCSATYLQQFQSMLASCVEVMDRKLLTLCLDPSQNLILPDSKSLFERFQPLIHQSLRRYLEGLQRDALQRKMEQARQLENLAEGLILLNKNGLCTLINPEAQRLLEVAEADLIGKPLQPFIAAPEPQQVLDLHQPAPPVHDNFIEQALACDNVTRSDDLTLISANGRRFPVSLSLVPVAHAHSDSHAVLVFRDISDLKAREQALAQAKAAAEKANLAKSQFLSNMSHELRTPLNGILGFAQLLQQSQREPLSDRQHNHVRRIITSGEHLLALLNDILDLARIESGKMMLSRESVDVMALVDECVQISRQLASAKQVEVVDPLCHVDGSVWLHADRTRVRQVLLNLLSNAIKYNRTGGRVWIMIEPMGQFIRISVTDNGMGIPLDRQSELFTPFSRLGAENSNVEGTGIGLSICRQLIQLMHGKIGFHSNGSTGSTFWFDLPIGQPMHLHKPKQASGAAPADAADAAGAMHIRLLYIEDNPDNLVLMESIMSELANYTLLTANSAEVGIRLAMEDPPDVVLMDLNLPVMDGFAAFQVLRNDSRTQKIPVIAISADAMPETVQRAVRLGFNDYLTKPVQIDKLFACLKTWSPV